MVFDFSFSYLIKQANARPQWFLATFAAAIYFIIFIILALDVFQNDLWFGFCVWGKNIIENPPAERSCGDADAYPRHNSHLGCFYVGLTTFALQLVIFFTDKKRNEGNNLTMHYMILFILFFHGGLHWILQQVKYGEDFLGMNLIINCYRENVEKEPFFMPLLCVYALWTFFLSLYILHLGTNEYRFKKSIFLTVSTVAIVYNQPQFVLSALFVMTHMLCCWCGLQTENPPSVFSSVWVANTFTVVNTIAIVELVACEKVLKPFWGHVWYDIGLSFVALAGGLAIGGRDNFNFTPDPNMYKPTPKGDKEP